MMAPQNTTLSTSTDSSLLPFPNSDASELNILGIVSAASPGFPGAAFAKDDAEEDEDEPEEEDDLDVEEEEDEEDDYEEDEDEDDDEDDGVIIEDDDEEEDEDVDDLEDEEDDDGDGEEDNTHFVRRIMTQEMSFPACWEVG